MPCRTHYGYNVFSGEDSGECGSCSGGNCGRGDGGGHIGALAIGERLQPAVIAAETILEALCFELLVTFAFYFVKFKE